MFKDSRLVTLREWPAKEIANELRKSGVLVDVECPWPGRIVDVEGT